MYIIIIIVDIGTSAGSREEQVWGSSPQAPFYSESRHLFQKMKYAKNLILKTENSLTIKNKCIIILSLIVYNLFSVVVP
jgi:hypothetical protein